MKISYAATSSYYNSIPPIAGLFRKYSEFHRFPSDLVLLYDGNWMDAVDGPLLGGSTEPTYEFRHSKGLSLSGGVNSSNINSPGKCNVLMDDCHVQSFGVKQLPTGSFYTASQAAAYGSPHWFIDEPQ
jgi:hypothetical protein